MPHRLLLVLLLALCLGACDKLPGTSNAAAPAPAPAPLLISAEDVQVVRSNALASGPSITGSIQPERRADLRAEVQAVVLEVLKENGDVVRRGDLLVRLDSTAIRDAYSSAEASGRAAQQALDQAERQFQRMKTLRTSGMASAQALDDAEGHLNSARSDVEAAKARLVLAKQQMTRTEVRAPFDGIVTDRKASPGDTAQVGKELLKVIDPRSMRFEGSVPSDQVGEVRAGQPVSFRVNGYADQEFTGRVRRVNPAANTSTRQVEVLVDFVGDKQPKLAGLYAEGRIETSSAASLTIPSSALVRDGDKASAWRVSADKLQKVPVVVGDRDPRRGDYVVKSGLAEGDQVIRYPTATLKDGQPVQLAGKAATSMMTAGDAVK
ncbi:MAG TPA: efflux RND transporter periplasmic adaptor subunit [Usitatibacter sp.]|nr:efflux RND transporter periplasmic adaptor subunit [Usitatibacter sp.]